MATEKLIGQATAEQIATWKRQYGEVYAVKATPADGGDRHVCYVKVPGRKALGAASEAGRNNPIRFSEIILRQCWIAGSEEIRDRDDLFLSVSARIAELIRVGEAQLEKL
ncbi:MAG: hypothetical protein LUE10_04970 [Alistipes sp.]|nr:hypothetical protein [Alistipes sp.]